MEPKGKKLAEKLARLMNAAGVSQAALAAAAGMQQNAISRVLAGEQKLYLHQAKRIADYLKCDVDFLADDDLDEPRRGELRSDEERMILRMSRAIGYDAAILRLMNPPVVEQRGGGGSGPGGTHWIASGSAANGPADGK